MKIAYVHFSNPDTIKIHDTKIARIATPCILRKNPLSQDEFDIFTINKLKSDKEKGYILFYDILDDESSKNKASIDNTGIQLKPRRRILGDKGFMWFVFDTKTQHVCTNKVGLKVYDTKAECQAAINAYIKENTTTLEKSK